ncbi:MAG: hypothetical protein ISS48_03530 [Candidatus Aenigmarchaeota archaeon]|nr:hypothetical protein [Candidatus Aenigmarchaeota archaeon]
MKKICFICNLGEKTSHLIKTWFDEYLSNNKINSIEVVNAGINSEGNEFHIKNICESDVLILAYKGLEDKIRELNPNAELLQLEQLCSYGRSLGKGSTYEGVFEYLVDKFGEK